VGIKPGLGVVPAGLGNGSWFDMAENGPLATTVADCAALLSVLAGRPELAEVDEPSALRIAVSTRNPIQGFRVDRSWADTAPAAGGILREAGHTVRQANPPYGPVLGPSSLARWMAGTELDARLLADRSRLARRTSAHATAGRLLLRAGFPKDAGRDRWRRRAEAFFADHDVLVTPALAQSPIPSIAWSERGWLANLLASVRYAPFAAPWNVAGWPAIAVPTGVGADGMPRAVQLVGRPGSEATLLGLAAQIERRRPWPRVAPSYSPAHQ
jgi:amidase